MVSLLVPNAGLEVPHYSLRQRFAVQLRRRPHVRRHLFDGATRSGKTWSAVPGFVNWALAYPEPASYLASNYAWVQIRESLIPEFQRYAAEIGFGDIEPEESGTIMQIAHARFVFRESGKHDSAAKLKSMKYRGVYIDEVTEATEEFVLMAESRCLTYPDWKSVFTCNPEGPGHWVKRLYLDPAERGERDYERVPFLIPDNPAMTDEDIAKLFRNNSALWRSRMIDGEWVAATGAVYPEWQEGEPPAREPDLRWMSLDYAASGVMHALLIEQYDDHAWVVDEKRYDGRAEGPLRIERKTSLLLRWLGTRRVALVLADSSTPNDMVDELAERLGVYVLNAPNVGRETINATAAWLEQPYLTIAPRCVELVRELGTYVWDERAAARGVDKPVEGDDHGVDALLYGVSGYPQIRRYGRFNVVPIEHAMDEAA